MSNPMTRNAMHIKKGMTVRLQNARTYYAHFIEDIVPAAAEENDMIYFRGKTGAIKGAMQCRRRSKLEPLVSEII